MLSSIGQRLLFLLLLLLPAGFPCSVYAIQFNAYWSYRESGGEDIETRSRFIQRYSLGVGPSLTYRPTHAITASAGIGYTHSRANAGQGFTSSHALSPSARMSLVNDIFRVSLSGNTGYTDNGSGLERSNSFWDSAVASTWNIPLWPRLALTYSEVIETDGGDQNSTNFTVNWDLLLAQLSYRSGISKSADDTIQSKNTYHSARLDTGGSFWNNRLNLNFSQQFQKNNTDIVVVGLGDGSFDFPLEGLTASAATDPLTGPDPEDVALDSNPQLGDGDLENVALAVAPDQRANLGISLEFSEDIALMRLTLDPFSTLTDDQAVALQWDLYVRNPFDTGWELQTPDVPFTYDSAEKQFELGVDINAAEIMVVTINQADIALDFTELEVFSLLEEDNSSSTTAYLTTFGMNMVLTRTLRASANLNLEHAERDFNENIFESDRRTVSGNLRWSPVAYVTPSLGFSESRVESTGSPVAINRIYSLTVPTHPLPTLSVSFGTTLNERYSDDQKTFSSTRYNMYTRAVLYPDLNASWNLTYQEAETLDAEGLVLSSNVTSTRLEFMAQLYRDLFADITTSYAYRERETGTTTQSGDAGLSLRYRPSDMLALRGAYTTFFLDSQSVDKLNIILNMTLINNLKSRLGFNANYTRATTQSTLFALTWNWNISKYFSLVSNGSYRIGDVNSYNFVVSLSLRL